MTRNYNAEIIAVGTELLLGQIANTNAQWISEKLAELGIHVYFHSVVGDNLDRVEQVFKQAGSRSDIVLVTGGLGPTEDDLTREAFQKMTGFNVIEDNVSMTKINSFFQKANRTMTPNNRKQSLVFEKATVFPNSAGMAPGMGITHNKVKWFFMPGVPREMKVIMKEGIIPELKSTLSLTNTISSRMLRFIGIGESQLEHELKELINGQTNPTIAPLAGDGEVALRLTAKAASEEEATHLIDKTEEAILQLTGEYFYGYDDEDLNKKIMKLLQEKNMSIAAAESLTGGKFTDNFISLPGASAVVQGGIVAYSRSAKENVLHISSDVVEKNGTVSEACAAEMAENSRRLLEADIGMSFTGVAGPSEEEGKEPGTVFIGLASVNGKNSVRRFHFSGDRESIRNRAVKKGMELLLLYLKGKVSLPHSSQ